MLRDQFPDLVGLQLDLLAPFTRLDPYWGTAAGVAAANVASVLGVWLVARRLFGPARRVEAFGGICIPQRTCLIPGRFGEMIDVTSPDHLLIHLDFGENRFAQVLSSFALPRSKAPALEIHAEQGTVSMSQEAWYDPNAPLDLWQRDESAEPSEGWTTAQPIGPSLSTNLIQAGPEGAIVSEFSTTSRDESDVFTDLRIRRLPEVEG